MKLVIEHQEWRGEKPYVLYLDTADSCMLEPFATFSTEAEARRYCEQRQNSKVIAEYEI